MVNDAPNIQALWANLIVEELVRNGVEHFVVCPGSRSTPLVQAVVRNPRAKATVWLDERGAAFHALGHARAEGWATAVVTTSGTAVANLLPAVVEASLDRQPLLLLTADRPPELREVGANQSIKQMGIFADHTRWSFDLPVPSTAMPARALLSTIDEAVHRAVDGQEGPVQINCPFREPLAPTEAPWDRAWLEPLARWLADDEALVEFPTGDLYEDLYAEDLATRIRSAERGLIVCGTLNRADADMVSELATQLGWPAWTDIRSDLRLGTKLPERHAHIDRLLGRDGVPQPDLVLQFGGRLTSKPMQAALDRGDAATYILVDPEPSRLDPGHCVTHRVISSVSLFCANLLVYLEDEPPANEPLALRAADDAIERALGDAVDEGEALSEPWVARWLSKQMHASHGLFLSNSMPIRDMQGYAALEGPGLFLGANRGASGIDGILSTAAGFARGHAEPTTLLVGDLAFVHDLNALMHLRELETPLTIVVLNNGGGSIFSFLPIAAHPDVLTPFIETPHGVSFDGVCASFGIPYAHVDSRAGFEAAYRESIATGASSVIEVASSLAGNRTHHARIDQAIDQAIAETIQKAL